MAVILSEEQLMLRESAQTFLADQSPVTRMRELRDAFDEKGYTPEIWRQMADLGWLGILLDEDHGGSGMGVADLGVVLWECGRVLAPEPLLSTLLLGANAVRLSGNEPLQKDVLPAVAEGDRIVAFALEETGRFDPYGVATKVEGGAISGTKLHVLDAHVADQIVVVARTAGAVGDRDGLALYLVDASASGVTITRNNRVDGRNVAQVEFDGVEVGADRLLGNADLLDRVIDQATVGLAAEMLGTAEEAFERTLQYLKDREQFGEKIGTFQALRHRAAEMFSELEFARSIVRDALSAVDEGREDAAQCVSAAKAQASKAGRLIGAEAIQMHGGIGMTDEEEIGLFFKRLKAAELSLGDETYHQRRFATLQGY
ncbi:MAG: acyl-CoA dehydrogenase family protein [bacterium]|nr:acyl-CoA dehydrogenase family protein [bacterium]